MTTHTKNFIMTTIIVLILFFAVILGFMFVVWLGGYIWNEKRLERFELCQTHFTPQDCYEEIFKPKRNSN